MLKKNENRSSDPIANDRPTGEAGIDAPTNGGRREVVMAFANGIEVIKAFTDSRSRLTLSELALRTGLSRASARRFLRTLEALGYVESNGRYFRLRPKLLELGYSYLSSQPWWRMAQRLVEGIAREHRCPCSSSVLDGEEILYLAHAIPVGVSTFSRSVGTRLPIFVSAMGRVMLAHAGTREQDAYLNSAKLISVTPHTIVDPEKLRARLIRCREDGYAVIDQELEVGLRSIAVPIFDRGGHVPAAIGLSVHRPLPSVAQTIDTYFPILRQAADEISESIPT